MSVKVHNGKFAVLFFNRATNNTELSNLGQFETPEAAQEASNYWADGFARKSGYVPTTSIIPVAQMAAVVNTDVVDALNACWDVLSDLVECDELLKETDREAAIAAIEMAQAATAGLNERGES